MRPIKFKAKRDENLEWVFGFVQFDYFKGTLVNSYIYVQSEGERDRDLNIYSVIPSTVCQLIKVINGVEIYEKDYDAEGNMIDYCEECMGYQFFQIDQLKDVIFCHNCDGNFMVQDHIDEFRILGNVND